MSRKVRPKRRMKKLHKLYGTRFNIGDNAGKTLTSTY
jgi:hypothetical protein